jgi:hypothetical protein
MTPLIDTSTPRSPNLREAYRMKDKNSLMRCAIAGYLTHRRTAW